MGEEDLLEVYAIGAEDSIPHPSLGDFAMSMNFDTGILYPEY